MASVNWAQYIRIVVGSPRLATGISVSLDGMRQLSRHSRLSWLVKPLQT